MTKQDYIKSHPKSMLAKNLTCNDWSNDTEITIVGGLNAPNNKQSNLHKALIDTTGEYVVGGHRQRGTEGWWYAVKN